MVTVVDKTPATPATGKKPDSEAGEYGRKFRIRDSAGTERELVMLAYELNPTTLSEFKQFYKSDVIPWLQKEQKVGDKVIKEKVQHAHAWIANNQLIVMTAPGSDVPWVDGITPPSGTAAPGEASAAISVTSAPTTTASSATASTATGTKPTNGTAGSSEAQVPKGIDGLEKYVIGKGIVLEPLGEYLALP